jgi:hypothetical protein
LQKSARIAGLPGEEAGRGMIGRNLQRVFFASGAMALAPALFGTAGPSGVSGFVTVSAAKVNAPRWSQAVSDIEWKR